MKTAYQASSSKRQFLTILGPSSSGKTTLWRDLMRSRECWVSPDGALSLEAARLSSRSDRWAQRLPFLGKELRYAALCRRRREASADFWDAHQGAAQLFWTEFRRNEDHPPGAIVRFLTRLYEEVAHYTLLSRNSGPAILMEQHSYWWLLVRGGFEDTLSALPLPDAVIALSAPLEVLIQRRRLRDRRSERNYLKSTSEAEMLERTQSMEVQFGGFYALCESRGVPIMRLDTTNEWGSIVLQSRTFLADVARSET